MSSKKRSSKLFKPLSDRPFTTRQFLKIINSKVIKITQKAKWSSPLRLVSSILWSNFKNLKYLIAQKNCPSLEQ